MSTPATYYLGVDVAQDSLALAGVTPAQVDNQPAALRAWLSTLRSAQPTVHLICEATGRHHHVLQIVAAECGVPLSVINPRHARHFARSLGRLEKTDPIDAAMLQRLGQSLQPKPTPPPPGSLRQLQDLLVVRQALVEEQTAWANRQALLSPVAGRLCARRQRTLAQELIEVESQIHGLLATTLAEPLQLRVQTLCLVCGIGERIAWSLVAGLAELGQGNRRQLAKLAGLAPLPADSGQWRGARHIAHGRAPVRRSLYQAAVVAARHNEHLRPFYLRLRAKGKPAKVAYVAVARKLLVFLNRILKDAPPLTP
jgi:transposase